MPSKPAQDIWYELWQEAGSRGLDTWYMLKGMDSVRDSDHPLGAGRMRVLERKAFSTCPYHHVLPDHDFGGGSRATAKSLVLAPPQTWSLTTVRGGVLFRFWPPTPKAQHPSRSQASPLVPQTSDAQRLGVEERHVPAIAARDPHDPCAFGEVGIAFFQERPNVGSLAEFPAVVPASGALDDRFRAHPPLQDPALVGTKRHRTSLLYVAPV